MYNVAPWRPIPPCPGRSPIPAPTSDPVLAILGGTGDQGRGLALRWSAAGYRVVIGSRDVARARAAAADIAGELAGVAGARVPEGAGNLTAAAAGEVVVVSVPYGAMAATAAAVSDQVGGKIVLSVVVPLRPPRVSTVWLPPAGSAAAELQALLPKARVVAAFQNVAAGKLARRGADVGCDVLVCGDDAEAKAMILALAAAMDVVAFDAGPLANAGVVEGLTAVLIGINRRLRVAHAGIRVSNVPRPGA